jgi:hypothetical protein
MSDARRSASSTRADGTASTAASRDDRPRRVRFFSRRRDATWTRTPTPSPSPRANDITGPGIDDAARAGGGPRARESGDDAVRKMTENAISNRRLEERSVRTEKERNMSRPSIHD